MKPFQTLHSHTVTLSRDNVDTDQIIPASYLRITDKQGLGQGLFANWRYLDDGSPNPEFVLNHPASQGATILVGGDNFGCGSSREHAPWALLDYGFRAVVSSRFADIFRNNALKNGLLTVTVSPDMHRELLAIPDTDPGAEVTINLEACTIQHGDSVAEFTVDAFGRHCLLNGVDPFGYLLEHRDAIAAYESSNPARVAIDAPPPIPEASA